MDPPPERNRYNPPMKTILPLLLLLGTGCAKEPTACEQLEEEVCACEGEAADYHCDMRTEQANEANRLLENEETKLHDDAQEVCGEVYEAFIDAGGCGSLTIPEDDVTDE